MNLLRLISTWIDPVNYDGIGYKVLWLIMEIFRRLWRLPADGDKGKK